MPRRLFPFQPDRSWSVSLNPMRSITMFASTVTHARPFALAIVAAAALSPTLYAARQNPIGTNQRTLVICVKYDDAATTRLANASDWVTLLSNEVNTFYSQATFNKTSFQFETPSGAGAPADGWFDLGLKSTDYEFFKVGQAAITLADPYVDFSLYNRALIMTNWPGFGGQGGGPWGWTVKDGIEYYETEDGTSVGKRLMTMAIVNEWLGPGTFSFDRAGSVAAHEFGHQLGVPTHYADLRWFPGLSRDVITWWDIMGLSPSLNHFCGWAKLNRQWIPGSLPRVLDVGPPAGSNIDQTITLKPLEIDTADTQIIRIPIAPTAPEAPFDGYLVENRRKITGDENLPNEGVLIYRIDESPNIVLKCIVMDDATVPGNNDEAPLEVGGKFEDPARNLSVEVVGQSGDDYRVRIRYAEPPVAKSDPMIIPWGAPPWETVDIWIDSEKNGWDTYKYTDGLGNPTGNGDDAWVGHDNRVYVRVRNIGPGTASNVRVQVFQNSPPGMGDAGPDWSYRGTIVIPTLNPGNVATDFVRWKPSVGEHTCIKAVIDDTPDELSTANNTAQENVTAFDTSEGSPYQPVGLAMTVYNPFPDRKLPVRMHVRDVPLGWLVSVEPREFLLAAGGRDKVRVSVHPSGPPDVIMPPQLQEQMRQYRPGYIGKPKVEAQVAYADTFIPLGGVEVWTHLTRPTKLTCDLNPNPDGPAPGVDKEEPGIPPRPEMPNGQVNPGEVLFERGALVRKPQRPPEIPVGQLIVVGGWLVPPVAGTQVAVEFTSDGKRVLQFAKTDGKGFYMLRTPIGNVGTWRLQAFFAGDQTREAAESPIRQFRVIKAN